jgi:DNA-binding GntR family transcriptional regulator
MGRRTPSGARGPRVDRRGAIGPQVYDLLRAAILDLTLKPGQAVSVKGLAEEWTVSRTPVRDALIRLAREGLVVVYAQSGTFVSRIDLDDVEEARFARSTLECAAIEDAMGASEADLAELRWNVARQRALDPADGSAWSTMYELDAELHRKLIAISGHYLIWDLVREPLAHMERVRRLLASYSSQIEEIADTPRIVDIAQIVDEHERIVEAVARRDPAAAREAMADHLSKVRYHGELLAARVPEFFESSATRGAPESRQTPTGGGRT